MKALLYHIGIQWKLDLRNKNVLVPFYIIPIIFFLFMSGIFTSIIPDYNLTLLQSMIVFSVTMGAVLGTPMPLSEIYGTEVKKAYKLGNIPVYVPILVNFVSSFLHILIVCIIITILAPILYGGVFPQHFGNFALSLIAFILASIGIGTFIGTHFKSASGLVIAGQAIFLPSLILSGTMFPLSFLPSFLQEIAYLLPATLGNVLMSGSSFQIWLFLALLGIFVLSILFSVLKVKKIDKER